MLSDTWSVFFSWSFWDAGVGLNDRCGPLVTQNILWFFIPFQWGRGWTSSYLLLSCLPEVTPQHGLAAFFQRASSSTSQTSFFSSLKSQNRTMFSSTHYPQYMPIHQYSVSMSHPCRLYETEESCFSARLQSVTSPSQPGCVLLSYRIPTLETPYSFLHTMENYQRVDLWISAMKRQNSQFWSKQGMGCWALAQKYSV